MFFEDVNNLRDENIRLQGENRELREELSRAEIIRAENEILREFNNMTEMFQEYETVPAYIIDKNVTNLSDVFVINAGRNQGVYANMPVISGEGLVGFIASSTDNTAKVAPIIDPSTAVSARITASRETVMTRGLLGNNREVRLSFIPVDVNLLIGDAIETSGLGGIYPKGIRIGTITEIRETRNIIDRYAVVETAVDFSRLETVLVITNH